MVKIGVIIPTYNRHELLLRALYSLQEQDFTDWEAYIVDDCSREDSYAFLDKYHIWDDKRIHFIQLEKNSGVNVSRNTALKKILENETITHITLLDDDDYFLKSYFSTASKILKEKQVKWLVSLCIAESGENITQIEKEGYVDYMDYLLGKKVKNDATMLIQKSLLQGIWFTTQYKNGYEWAFFLKLSTRSRMYVVNLPSKVVTYLETGLSLKKRKRDRGKKAFQKQIFKECSYDFYDFLAKKHQDSNKIKSYYYATISNCLKRLK